MKSLSLAYLAAAVSNRLEVKIYKGWEKGTNEEEKLAK